MSNSDSEDIQINKCKSDGEDESDDSSETSDLSDSEEMESTNNNANRTISLDDTRQLADSLEKEISESPHLYDKHIHLIEQLKLLKDAKKIKEARIRMNNLFPLTQELWLDWLKDEKEDLLRIELFEKAVKDYLSIPVWIEYIFHAMRNMNEPNGVENVRVICERALSHVGLHVKEGQRVWDTYRDFETVILSNLQPLPGSIATTDQQRAIATQIARMKKLFKRQLTVPLWEMRDTMKEYEEWTEDGIANDKELTLQYNNALKILEGVKVYEQNLETSASPHLAEYNAYIDYEISKGDPARIQCLFERAVVENCLAPQLWITYLTYMDKQIKVGPTVLLCHERSIRNCPWSAELWVGYLCALERTQSTHEKIRATFNDSLISGMTNSQDYLQVWTFYIDYLRRRINWDKEDHEIEISDLRNAFDNANIQLLKAFSSEGDPECSLLQYQAMIEAKYCKQMTKARELFSQIMQSGLANKAQMWINYIQLERSFGDIKHCRKVIQRALNSVNDYPETIVDLYLKFEHEEGDLFHYEEALGRCKSQLKRIEERRQKEAEKQELLSMDNKGKYNHKKQEEKLKNNSKFQNENFYQNKKIANKTKNLDLKKTLSPQKKNKFIKKNINVNENSKQKIINSNLKENSLINNSSTYQGNSQPKMGQASLLNNEKIQPYIRKEQSKKDPAGVGPSSNPPVFIRGETNQKRKHEEIENHEVFKFEKVIVLEEKKDLDGFKLPPPPGFIAKQTHAPPPLETFNEDEKDASPKKKIKGNELNITDHRSSSGTLDEKNKCTVFVSNIDFSVGEDKLMEVFSKVGSIKEIRIVKNFKGRSKGYAYVEFTDEFPIDAALKLDRELIENRPMYVSLCNPNKQSTIENKIKFNVGLEKNKLFIKNVPLSATKDQLESIFSTIGKLRDVRLVIFKSGKPKGLAYIEYEDETSAAQAVLKLDGYTMDNQLLSVAISNPPPRNINNASADSHNQFSGITSFVPSLGGGKKDTGRGNARTQLSMMLPRNITKRNPKENSTLSRPLINSSNDVEMEDLPNSATKMSNSDFRNMLLNK